MTYTMDVETAAGVRQHPYHLGTIFEIAERCVLEKVADPKTYSVALRRGDELIGIYDWRSL